MKIGIIFKSLTGNTRMLAEAIRGTLADQELVCFGEPSQTADADLYFVGSWTDKGTCDGEITQWLKGCQNKRLAYFGTAGFGGSAAYYDAVFERVQSIIPDRNAVVGHFLCQGKMPPSVRERYASLLSADPENEKLKANIENFDRALSHPDSDDLQKAAQWARSLIQ